VALLLAAIDDLTIDLSVLLSECSGVHVGGTEELDWRGINSREVHGVHDWTISFLAVHLSLAGHWQLGFCTF
jgi:hypothetical protein